MTDGDGGRSVIDEAVVDDVADRYDLPAGRLRELIEDHQAAVAALPGVEELVYEWRKHFDGAVVARTERTYYLAVPAWVWDEFGADLGATEREVEGLAEAHRQGTLDVVDDAEPLPEGETFVVLDRTA